MIVAGVVVALLVALYVARVGLILPGRGSELAREAAAAELERVRFMLHPRGPYGSRRRKRQPLRTIYSYRYVIEGPGTADEGDHDEDKIVVRADPRLLGLLVIVRSAPVDRLGRRVGRGRLIGVHRG